MEKSRKRPPARTPEQREKQLISLAVGLAERQLRDGSASSQVITHFLKLATTKEKLENEKLRADLDVARAKIKQIESGEEMKTLFKDALDAMRKYSGNVFSSNEDKYDDYED